MTELEKKLIALFSQVIPTMTEREKDSYTKMVEDGRDFISILISAPENKRLLASIIAEVYLNGLNTGEKLADVRQARSGA